MSTRKQVCGGVGWGEVVHQNKNRLMRATREDVPHTQRGVGSGDLPILQLCDLMSVTFWKLETESKRITVVGY